MTQNENVYAIFCRPEVAGGGVFSGGNVKTREGYSFSVLKLLTSAFSEQIKISLLCNAYPYFVVNEKKCLIVYKENNEDLESQFPKQ